MKPLGGPGAADNTNRVRQTAKTEEPEAPRTTPADLLGPELAAQFEKAAFSGNAKTEFVWALEAVLGQRMAEGGGSAKLASVLAAGKDGTVNRQAFSDALFDVAHTLCGHSPLMTAEEAAEQLLARDDASITTSFAALMRAAAPRPNVDTSGGAQLALGRSIATAVVTSHTAEDDTSNLAMLIDRVGRASPFAWGALAQACGIDSAETFLTELAGADASDLAGFANFMQSAHERFATMEDIEARRGGSATGASLRALTIDPKGSEVLQAQAQRIAEGLSDPVAGPSHDDVFVAMVNRQRLAGDRLGLVFESLEKHLGPKLAAEVTSNVDVAATMASLADPRHGSRVFADLDAPGPIGAKAEHLHARLLQDGLRRIGDDLRDAIGRRPELASVARMFRDAGPRSAAVRQGTVALLERYGPPGEGKASERLGALAQWARGEGALDAVVDGLVAECQRDGIEVVAQELAGHVDALAQASIAARQTVRETEALERNLGANELGLEPGVVADMKSAMAEAFPFEGMGYLVYDGAAHRFLPVRNLLHGTDMGHSMGVVHPEDVEHVDRLVQAFGLDIRAKVHSHPDESPLFSEGDLEGARGEVALFPGFRTVIVGVTPKDEGFDFDVASFSSGADGFVRGEDRL